MTRTNRALTNFVIAQIEEFVNKGPRHWRPSTAGNTAIKLNRFGDIYELQVNLFDNPIAELIFVENDFQLIKLKDGRFFDKYGRPSRTTRERLNGILDYLGESGLIPADVRIFVEEETNKSYVGRGSIKLPIGKDYPPAVIQYNPVSLVLSHE